MTAYAACRLIPHTSHYRDLLICLCTTTDFWPSLDMHSTRRYVSASCARRSACLQEDCFPARTGQGSSQDGTQRLSPTHADIPCFWQILEQSLQQRLASAQSLSLDSVQAPNALALATQTEGYSATDLRDLVGRAVHVAVSRAAADSQLSGAVCASCFQSTEPAY